MGGGGIFRYWKKKHPKNGGPQFLRYKRTKFYARTIKFHSKKKKKIVKKNKPFLLLTNLAKRLIGLQVIWFIVIPDL